MIDHNGIQLGRLRYGNASDADVYEQLAQVKAEIAKLEKSGDDPSRLDKLRITKAGLEKMLKKSE